MERAHNSKLEYAEIKSQAVIHGPADFGVRGSPLGYKAVSRVPDGAESVPQPATAIPGIASHHWPTRSNSDLHHM